MRIKITFAALCLLAVFLTAADTQTDALQQQISKLRLENAVLTRRLLEASQSPIEVGRRKAMLGGGYVIQVANVSAKTIPIKVHLENPTFGKETNVDLIMPPAKIVAGIKEIGHLQGWTAAPGDIVTITGEGLTTIKKELAE